MWGNQYLIFRTVSVRFETHFPDKPAFLAERHELFPSPAWWRSQALKPLQRPAAGVGLDDDVERQASISGP
jgi:hypothetical protein